MAHSLLLGRASGITGCIERGSIDIGEFVEIVGIKDGFTSCIVGIEMFHKTLDRGIAGDSVGLIARGILDRDFLNRGMVVAKPGTITPHTEFESEVYVLTKQEGGRHTPFFRNYRPQFHLRTADVAGIITDYTADDGGAIEKVMPGDRLKMTVKLIKPIAMEKGLSFVIREGDRTIGIGVVDKIIK